MSPSNGKKRSARKPSASSAANRPPGKVEAQGLPTPGSTLRELLLKRYDITQDELAEAMGTTRYSVNQILNDARALTAEMAVRIAKVTDTSPRFWLNIQQALDVRDAETALRAELARIKPLGRSGDRRP